MITGAYHYFSFHFFSHIQHLNLPKLFADQFKQRFWNFLQVLMQNLLDYTAEKILILQKDATSQIKNITRCMLRFRWFSGSIHYCPHFYTCKTNRCKSTNYNARHSVWFCRPLKNEYAKQSHLKILREKGYFDMPVAGLKDFIYAKKKAKQLSLLINHRRHSLTDLTPNVMSQDLLLWNMVSVHHCMPLNMCYTYPKDPG